MNKNKKFDLRSNVIEEELRRVNYRARYMKLLKNTIFILIVVAAIATIIASFVLSVLEIYGSSMNPTLKEGQVVIAYKSKDIEQKDLIAFYQGNKLLVKRVIAKQGDYVKITDDGDVYINGKKLEEPYICNKSLGESDIKYPYQVPDGHYFVLGDNRETSIDSRNSAIGAVAKEDILGEVMVRIWPINKLGIVK